MEQQHEDRRGGCWWVLYAPALGLLGAYVGAGLTVRAWRRCMPDTGVDDDLVISAFAFAALMVVVLLVVGALCGAHRRSARLRWLVLVGTTVLLTALYRVGMGGFDQAVRDCRIPVIPFVG
ncbi:hypothetical protein [Kitasatospora sp. NPDC088346]|uniref:hypothetical protein n=1 Tax=Kitasatospora sp. NPDC088346 TaxID=3364073 RepID=UPI003811B254